MNKPNKQEVIQMMCASLHQTVSALDGVTAEQQDMLIAIAEDTDLERWRKEYTGECSQCNGTGAFQMCSECDGTGYVLK